MKNESEMSMGQQAGTEEPVLLVTGAAGFIGYHLSRVLLAGGRRVVGLDNLNDYYDVSLKQARLRLLEAYPTFAYVSGGVEDAELLFNTFRKFEPGIVVHLAGQSVMARRWNQDFRHAVRTSRVDAAETLVKACAAQDEHPRILISASATGYYGPAPEGLLTEDSSPGEGFLAKVCQDWEAAAQAGRQHGMCVTCLRLGVVLGPESGIMRRLVPVFRLGLGGPAGTGQRL